MGLWSIDGYGNNYRDYAQVRMMDSLKTGHCYYVEFFQNLANWAQYGVNNMAASFTHDTANKSDTNGILRLTPYIMMYGNPAVTDTLNWTRVAGIYKAKGGEHFLTIGNFFKDAECDTVNLHNTSPDLYPGAVYYIFGVRNTENPHRGSPCHTSAAGQRSR